MENEMDKWMRERLAEAKRFPRFKDAAECANTLRAPSIWQDPEDKQKEYIVTDITQSEAAYRAGYKMIGEWPEDDDIDEIEEA